MNGKTSEEDQLLNEYLGSICRRQIDFFMLFMSFMVKKIFAVFLPLSTLCVLRGRKVVGVAFLFSVEFVAFIII